MSRGRGAGYDRHITIFSPEERLFQSMRYAFEAVKAAGITSIGVRGKDSVCVVTQKKVPDKLLDQTTDARTLVQQARNEAAEFHHKYGYEMPVDILAKWIADKSQATSAGAKEQEAINFLAKKMKNDPSFTYDETVQTAISALQSVLQEDFKATEIEVGVAKKDNPVFRVLSTEEIDEHLTAISESD
ncbi:Proteasome subunit alpha type-6-like protein [Drosera capensis]